MARRKGGQRLIEMARKGREKREERETTPKPMVAGDPKFRLGPVGPQPPYEAFTWNVAPEKPGLFKKLLSKLLEGRDYSQPVEPNQEKYEKELGEAVKLLEKIEETLSKQSREPETLPSEKPGHKEEVAKLVKDRLADEVEAEAKRKKIRELIHLDNLPKIKALLAEPRKKEKKKRLSETVEAVASEPAVPEGNAFVELEAETMKRFPYPKDDPQMIEIYERIARAFEKEIGAPADFIRNEAIHTLIHSRVDPAFNKFYDDIVLINPEDAEVEEFTGKLQGEE